MGPHHLVPSGKAPADKTSQSSLDVHWRDPVAAIWRPRAHRVGKPLRKRALGSVSRPGGLRSRRAQVSPPLISH